MTESLTILTFTLNGSDKLKRVLPGYRALADELVVAVDDATNDDSEAVARQFSDRVVSIPHQSFLIDGTPGQVSASEIGTSHCTGEWILKMDHDETIGPTLTKARLAALISNRWVTHYWVPRRWAISDDRFISSWHWSVDYQLRLHRNLLSLMKHPTRQHEHNLMLGECGYLTHEWIVHWDLAWHSRKVREEKVRWYKSLSSYTGADFYLYEEQRYETLPIDYVPPRPAPSVTKPVSSDPFGCSIEMIEFPGSMKASHRYYVLLAIQNLSNRVFHPESLGIYESNINVSYHWHRKAGAGVEKYSAESQRSPLAGRIAPGETICTYLWVDAPPDPGEYLLQPDLVEERVAWASESVSLTRYAVQVTR